MRHRCPGRHSSLTVLSAPSELGIIGVLVDAAHAARLARVALDADEAVLAPRRAPADNTTTVNTGSVTGHEANHLQSHL
jgi:hypothetical protein